MLPPLSPEALSNQNIRIAGLLTGVHAILKPDSARVVALLLAHGFKRYILYIGQADADTIEISMESEEPQEEAARIRDRAHSRKLR